MCTQYAALRKQIDAATTTTDAATDMQEICMISRDAVNDQRPEAEVTKIVAEIPPVVLGRTTYRVVTGGRHGVTLLGPRGGTSELVRNIHNTDMWAHNVMSGYSVKSTWYRRNADGTFTRC